MSVVPEKNGCNVWLEEYGCFVHGDSYHFPNGMLVIRTCPQKIYGNQLARVHYHVPMVLHWFDEHDQYGVLIADAGPLHKWKYFGYDGVAVGDFERERANG